MILGMGKYKLVDFWKFTLPLYVIQILVLCGACVIVFPHVVITCGRRRNMPPALSERDDTP